MLTLIVSNELMRAEFNLIGLTVSKGYRLIVSDGERYLHFSPIVPDS